MKVCLLLVLFAIGALSYDTYADTVNVVAGGYFDIFDEWGPFYLSWSATIDNGNTASVLFMNDSNYQLLVSGSTYEYYALGSSVGFTLTDSNSYSVYDSSEYHLVIVNPDSNNPIQISYSATTSPNVDTNAVAAAVGLVGAALIAVSKISFNIE